MLLILVFLSTSLHLIAFFCFPPCSVVFFFPSSFKYSHDFTLSASVFSILFLFPVSFLGERAGERSRAPGSYIASDADGRPDGLLDPGTDIRIDVLSVLERTRQNRV